MFWKSNIKFFSLIDVAANFCLRTTKLNNKQNTLSNQIALISQQSDQNL